jgi:hypothetical protein
MRERVTALSNPPQMVERSSERLLTPALRSRLQSKPPPLLFVKPVAR